MTEVSAGNPCPFLRALVAQGQLADDVEPVGRVSRAVERVAASGDGTPRLPGPVLRLVALIANGLGPAQIVRTLRHGVRLSALRDGPLDKRGAGSRILDGRAEVVEAELARLDRFAADRPLPPIDRRRGRVQEPVGHPACQAPWWMAPGP